MFYLTTAIFVILAAYLAYAFYFKPQWEMKRYVHLVQSLGYRVLAYPFRICSNSFINSELKYLQEKGDAFYGFKH